MLWAAVRAVGHLARCSVGTWSHQLAVFTTHENKKLVSVSRGGGSLAPCWDHDPSAQFGGIQILVPKNRRDRPGSGQKHMDPSADPSDERPSKHRKTAVYYQCRCLQPSHLRNNVNNLPDQHRACPATTSELVHCVVSAQVYRHLMGPEYSGAHWQSPALLCSAARLAAAAQVASSFEIGACALPLPAQNKC